MVIHKTLFVRFKQITLFFFFIIFFAGGNFAWAEGSRDLYPSGKNGKRAYLRSHTTTNANWPFANHGVHYVYAKPGEILSLATSAQNTGGNSRIRLYDPEGNLVVNNNTSGKIPNRTAELAGPLLYGEAPNGNKYQGIYHSVVLEGIYRVELVARGTSDPSTSYNADANWTEANDAGIRAWDISVINTANTGFETGRVYTNVLNLTTGTSSPNTTGFYGIFYVLTKDGYTYRVNNNGNNGLYFTFMVNNNGFLDTSTGNPIYKSLNTTTLPNGSVHNPNYADTSKQITHKIFYTLPNPNLPSASIGAVPEGSTWLKNTVTEASVMNLSIKGVDGTEGQMGTKGGYIRFSTNTQGNYKITIASSNSPSLFEPRILSGVVTLGENEIFWDGLDGNGQQIPEGNFPILVSVQLSGAEVHFPFFDMEYNRFGTIVELLNHQNLTEVVSDIIYWDDSNISSTSNGSSPSPINNSHLPPANSVGISSNVNGHIWGVNGSGTSGLFGDNRSIDTWTFIMGEITEVESSLEVKIADLMISGLSSNTNEISLGEPFTVEVKVMNQGPSDAEGALFQLFLPVGVEGIEFQFDGNSCGMEFDNLEFNPITNAYEAHLNLPSGCEIRYTFQLIVYQPIDISTLEIISTILRPKDFTDPDATNPDIHIPPTNPFFECENNGLGGICNNISALNLLYNQEAVCIDNTNVGNFYWELDSNVDDMPMKEEYLIERNNLGYNLNIYKLNHTIQVLVNDLAIFSTDIHFNVQNQNIQFQDGDRYGFEVPAIGELIGSENKPILQINISNNGLVTMKGAKISEGELYPLVFANQVNVPNWVDGLNSLVIQQNQQSNLLIDGSISKQTTKICPCVKPGKQGTPTHFTDIGILTKRQSDAIWPKNVPNGYLVMDSSHKGFVLNHLTTEQRDLLNPIEGMLIYNTDLGCVQLYRGNTPTVNTTRIGWNCIERSCNE
jgi:hypothetical protein